jgi:hypothetical protein
METWQIIAIVVGVLVVAGVLYFVIRNQQHRRHLRRMAVQPLSEQDRERFLAEWKLCQTHFVDDPVRAVYQADRLVTDIMRSRGFSTHDSKGRFDDLSTAYPRVANNSREASAILARYRRGHSSTEDLRRAMVHYRELIDELIGGSHEEFRRVA